MSNNLRTRNGMPFNFVNGLKVRGMDIESLIPGIEGIPEAGSKYQFAGNGSNKAFTLPVTPYNKDAVDVYVKQLYVHPDDYTLVGDTVTLTEAPPAVVAGETYNVVIKVSLTTLNGYVNANRVSFEGENLDDILEKGKPLANYPALRAYAGAATQVRITDPGIAGFFYWDVSDTTSADNGGTIIVTSNGKRWKRLYSGAVSINWFESAQNAVSAALLGTVTVPSVTVPASELQLRGESLIGLGPNSKLQASSTSAVIFLGRNSTPSHWTRRAVRELTIDGNNKSSEGLRFYDTTSTELSGRWNIENVTARRCTKAIHKPNGNIGNFISNVNLSGNDYGIYAVGQTTPIMHAGADVISGGEISSSALAAIYIDSPQIGNGGTQIRGTIIEGNPGFGIFVKNWRTGFLPLLLDGVWFEANATAASVSINGVNYTPKDIYLENTVHCVIKNGMIPKIQLVNSNVSADSVFMSDGTSSYFIDDSSSMTVTSANIDAGAHKCVVETVSQVQRPNGTGAARWLSPSRVLMNGVLAEKLQALPFDGAGPFPFTGTATVNATSVADGRIFATCAELTIPTGYTLQNSQITISDGKWCVITVDVKLVSGDVNTLLFSCVDGVSLVSGLNTLVETKWKTISSISRVTTPGTVRMYLKNNGATPITIRLSAWQIMQFDTQKQALDYYNDRSYYK